MTGPTSQLSQYQFRTIVVLRNVLGGPTLRQVTNDFIIESGHALTNESEMYSTLCYVHADTSQLSKTLRPRSSRAHSGIYYQMEFDVILSLGLTEFKAQILWKEDVS